MRVHWGGQYLAQEISLLVCTLSPPAFLPSSFLSAAQPMDNIALIRYLPGPFRFQFPSAHDAHHPLFGAMGLHTQHCSGVHSVCAAVAPDQL